MPIAPPLREGERRSETAIYAEFMEGVARTQREKNKQLISLLGRIEWVQPPVDFGDTSAFCPVCKAFMRDGHKADCELSEVLNT